MQALYDVPAPAKLNLFLHVTGRRSDGYHLLQSVFMLIDWQDSLNFALRQDGQISREDLTTPLPPDDLCLRAASRLQAHTGHHEGVHIGVHKRIPAQAGMGGGSSNAATCLLALNRLWRLNLPLSRLCAIGEQLGADVPFFLRGRNAWVEGIGEQITPVKLPLAHFCVVKPAAGLATEAIFSNPALKRDTEPATILGFAANPYGFGHNDLQPVAQALCPDVDQALLWLAQRGLKGRMTGSGSAVFALSTHPAQPDSVQDTLTSVPSGWEVRHCSNLDVHPLWGWVASDN